VALHQIERFRAIGGADDVVAIGQQQLAKEGADTFGVIGDEHAAAAWNRDDSFGHEGGPLRHTAEKEERICASLQRLS
jgi:hypothetical protein